MESSVKSKVFGIGLSRTGTTTLHNILLQLGYQSNHFVNELLPPTDWDVLNNYDAFIDTPVPFFFKRCYELCPGGKFILTTRDKQEWLSSMKWMFSQGKIIWSWDKTIQQYHQDFYGTKSFNRNILSEHWDQFHREVKLFFKDKSNALLEINLNKEINVKELCLFLG